MVAPPSELMTTILAKNFNPTVLMNDENFKQKCT